MDIKTMVIKGQKGDKEALGQMYTTFAPQMRTTCAKLLKKQTPVIDDLVHDSFILAYTSLNKLKNPEKLGTWLHTIIRNVTIRYIETQETKHLQQLNTPQEDPLRQLPGSLTSNSLTLTNEIYDMINELPNGYQTILHLHIFDGYSHQEIGEILGIAAHSSSSQLSRAKSALQRIMRERKIWYVILSSIIIAPFYKLFFEKKQAVNNSIATHKKSNKIKTASTSQKTEVNYNANNKHLTIVMQKNKKMTAIYVNTQDTTYNTSNDTTLNMLKDEDVNQGNGFMSMDNSNNLHTDSSSHTVYYTSNDIHEFPPNNPKQHKWEITFSSTLGSSMKEDGVGTMISTASNTESNLLQKFNNWEAYNEDLLLNNPIPNEKIKTLMNIAMNNSGDIIEHEKHSSPITFGIALSKRITDYWNIETGLQYTLLRSTQSIGNNGYSIDRDQRLYYLGIPLRIVYRISDYKNMSIYTNAGITTNIPTYGKMEETYIEGYSKIPSENWRISAPWQFALNTSLCLQYKFTNRLGFYMEPTLNYNIPNGSNIHSIWTENPVMFTIPFGLRFTW